MAALRTRVNHAPAICCGVFNTWVKILPRLNTILRWEALSGVGKSVERDQYNARCFRVRPFRVKGLPSRRGLLRTRSTNSTSLYSLFSSLNGVQ